MGSSVELASVNMRLEEGVIRELHWHKEAEWAYVLAGEVRITAIDYEGGNFIDDLKAGDLWYFPSGVPHSLQGMGENGTEFLLVFDDGNFSEESTFILTDWLGNSPLLSYPSESMLLTSTFQQHTHQNQSSPRTSTSPQKYSHTSQRTRNTSSKAPSPAVSTMRNQAGRTSKSQN